MAVHVLCIINLIIILCVQNTCLQNDFSFLLDERSVDNLSGVKSWFIHYHLHSSSAQSYLKILKNEEYVLLLNVQF